MAAKWNYPETSTLKIYNNVDADGNLIVDGSVTAVTTKAISFKGYKTPTDDEDANAETSSYRAMATVIYGLFGLEEGLLLNTGISQANAEIDGDFE